MVALPSSRPLGPIWASRLSKLLDCPLQVAFEQSLGNGGSGGASPSPSALVGTAIHRCIELIIKDGLTLEQAWEDSCDEMSASGLDPRNAKPAKRAFLRLKSRLPELLALIDEHDLEQDPLPEEMLETSDGLLRGQPDLILLGENTRIVDYKSGTATTDGTVNPNYVTQLLFYACLVADTFEKEQIDAWLFSLQDGLIPVDVSEEPRVTLLEDARRAIGRFDEAVPETPSGNPSNEACGWCNFALDCDEFWLALEDGRLDDPSSGQALEGKVVGTPVNARNGRSALSLDVRRGSLTGHFVVGNIPTQLVQHLQDGQLVRIVRLRLQRGEESVLVWRDHSSRMTQVEVAGPAS